jgi:hypothetical protein
MNDEPSVKEMAALWNACYNFIKENEIGHVEQIWQTDSIIIASPELVERVCEIVGYAEYEE